ncbi:MAG: HlyC/CorC family transporter [Chloroflexi bacterium]|nr:HlyC/CorC family transporter [Chloroflexota bacterium]
MDPASWPEILLTVGFVLLVGLAASAQASLSQITRPHAKRLEDGGVSGASTLRLLVEDGEQVHASLSLLKGIFSLLALYFGWRLAQRWQLDFSGIVLSLFGITLLLFLVHSLARAWAAVHPQATALALAGPVQISTLPLRPFIALGHGVESRLVKTLGGEAATLNAEEEFRVIVGEHEEELPIEEDEKQMIASIFEFGQTIVREVMVPRPDMAAVEVNSPLSQAMDLIIQAGHSRVPVYRGEIDHIVGILYAKDLLRTIKDGSLQVPLESIIRPAYFVPETNKVDELLQDMQSRRVHMAIVVDEYGGTAGLVTIEDLIEEIVGEIQDEYDTEEPNYQLVNPQEIIFDARIDPQDVNRIMELELPTAEGDTLAGLVLGQLGRLPVAGEEISLLGAKLTILAVSGRRIRKVKVSKSAEPASS